MITIGLDLGTSTISGAIFDGNNRKALRTCTLPINGKIKSEYPWLDLQDPLINWEICQILLNEFLKEYPDIAGIGLSGQMHGIVYVDKNGKAVSPLATWQDGRGDQAYRDGESYVGYLTKKGGYHMATGYGLATHFYNVQIGLVPETATSFCTIADYIGMQLTNRNKPLMHASQAHGFGMFDLQKMDFDLKAISRAGIDPEILPEVAVGEKVIGRTAKSIPVWIAIGDNQAGFLSAAGVDNPIVVNIGTSSQLSVRSKSLVTAEGLDIRPYVNGEYILVGAGLCGGSAYALLHSLLQEVLELYGVDGGDKLYEKMEQAAGRIKDNENLLEIDTRFRGTRIKPEIRGTIRQIGFDNFSVGHLAQGVMRGIVNELYEFYLQVPENLRTTEVMVGGGNALRHNTTLRALLAERFGMDLIISPHIEESAVGASMMACQ